MWEGFFGYSLVFELVVAYVIGQVFFFQHPHRHLYALLGFLIVAFVTTLDASGWSALFSGDLGSVFENWFS